MRTAVWIAAGFVAVTFWTAVASRAAPAWVFPDAGLLVLIFVALRREPVPVMLTAITLGYLVGRQALAPVGLHEMAMGAVSLGVYLLSGNLKGSGAFFFAFIAGVSTVAYHLLLFLLLYFFRGPAGFSSWATAALVLNGVATASLALVSFPVMNWLDGLLSRERHEGLQWG